MYVGRIEVWLATSTSIADGDDGAGDVDEQQLTMRPATPHALPSSHLPAFLRERASILTNSSQAPCQPQAARGVCSVPGAFSWLALRLAASVGAAACLSLSAVCACYLTELSSMCLLTLQ